METGKQRLRAFFATMEMNEEDALKAESGLYHMTDEEAGQLANDLTTVGHAIEHFEKEASDPQAKIW